MSVALPESHLMTRCTVFNLLPAELRRLIWSYADSPLIIRITASQIRSRGRPRYRYLLKNKSNGKRQFPPCREAWSVWSVNRTIRTIYPTMNDWLVSDSVPPRITLNPDVDLICLDFHFQEAYEAFCATYQHCEIKSIAIRVSLCDLWNGKTHLEYLCPRLTKLSELFLVWPRNTRLEEKLSSATDSCRAKLREFRKLNKEWIWCYPNDLKHLRLVSVYVGEEDFDDMAKPVFLLNHKPLGYYEYLCCKPRSIFERAPRWWII